MVRVLSVMEHLDSVEDHRSRLVSVVEGSAPSQRRARSTMAHDLSFEPRSLPCGAIQHLIGSRAQVPSSAINKDAEAPLFEVADIGLLGGLFKLLPELQAENCCWPHSFVHGCCEMADWSYQLSFDKPREALNNSVILGVARSLLPFS